MQGAGRAVAQWPAGNTRSYAQQDNNVIVKTIDAKCRSELLTEPQCRERRASNDAATSRSRRMKSALLR